MVGVHISDFQMTNRSPINLWAGLLTNLAQDKRGKFEKKIYKGSNIIRELILLPI